MEMDEKRKGEKKLFLLLFFHVIAAEGRFEFEIWAAYLAN